MAIIGDIRRNSWILIIGIALGMGGFILMDMLQNQSRMGGRSNDLGSINGKKIAYNDFAEKQDLRNSQGGDAHTSREELWNYFVNEAIVSDEAEALGLGVGSEELKERLYGQNISPVIYRMFYNPQTGIDPATIKESHDQFIASDNPQFNRVWSDLEDQVIVDALGSKLNTLVAKSMYTPTWMAEETKSSISTADVSFVKVPYDKIEENVQVTDDAIIGYMNENKGVYSQTEESRTVQFVSFEVDPTVADSNAIKGRIAALADQFRTVENDSAFIQNNDGSYDTQYFFKDAISEVIQGEVFSVPPGTVVGPYLDNGYFRAVKVVDRRQVADSVKIRQIYRQVENTKFNPAAVKAAMRFIKDSVETALDAGTPFGVLAGKFSQSQDAQTGGDVPMFDGNFPVPALRNKALYGSKKGERHYVVTPNGVHFMEIEKIVNTGKTGVRVAYVEEVIVPSEETQNSKFNAAQEFLRDNRSLEVMQKSASEKGMEINQTTVYINDYQLPETDLPAGDAARDMTKWAFSASPGQVSADVYTFADQVEFFDKYYVVAGLGSVTAPGIMALTPELKNQIKLKLVNKKKAEKLIASLSGKGLQAAAAAYNVTVDSAQGVSFYSGGASELGTEPNVLASVFSLSQGQESKPIAGENGVYVVRLNSVPVAPPSATTAAIRRQESQQLQRLLSGNGGMGTGGTIIEALKKKAEVSDNRNTFF